MQNKCVYFDGLSALAHPCSLHVEDNALIILLTEHNNAKLVFDKASVANIQLNVNHLTIKIGAYPHKIIEAQGDDVASCYQQLANYGFTNAVTPVFTSYIVPKVIAVVGLFVALCAVGFFVALPWAAEKAATLIPITTEIQLGNSLASSFTESEMVNDSATICANAFVKQLNTGSQYPIHITVIQSPEINAFALPGGNIVVYTGIINKMKTHEEFAALLGHEISHVNYQHSLKSICRTLSSSLFIGVLLGDISGISAGILQQANEFKQLNYSRDLETQADEQGLQLMLRNKISPKGMIDLLTLLQQEASDMPKAMKYFSTHPQTSERINNIKLKPSAKLVFCPNAALQHSFEQLQSTINDK